MREGFGGWKRKVNDLFDSSSHPKLEALNSRLVKRMIWEDGSGSAEREIARLEAVGELDGVVLHIVHWQTDEAIAAANELMRKLKASLICGLQVSPSRP